MVQDALLEFADKMSQMMPIIIKEFAKRQANELYKGKITFPQFVILEFLSSHADSKMTDIAHFMGVSTAAATGIVERLVKYEYVLRGFDPKDRRIIKIKLTARGTELVKKINQQEREMIIKIFGKISETDRQDYLRILTQIKDILTADSIVK